MNSSAITLKRDEQKKINETKLSHVWWEGEGRVITRSSPIQSQKMNKKKSSNTVRKCF